MNSYLQYFKDRLWKGLIESHPGIKNEYVSYVDAHLDEHRQRRWKHWLLLLRLNVHYRVFKNTGRLLEEKPRDAKMRYTAGSESEKAKREAPTALASKLMKYDIAAFDIFDTLILRKLNTQKGIFYIVGDRLGLEDYDVLRPRFEEGRRQIKSALFGTREINIDELYERVAYLTGIDAHEGMEAEYGTELDMCEANPYFLQVFNMLKDAGKPIYAISDMYIPKDRMLGILENAGYHGLEDVIVSCDYGVTKKDGGLYDVLKEKAGQGKKIAHVGDNYAADVTAAKNRGLTGMHYQACRLRGDPYRCGGMSPSIESSYRGVINTSLHNGSAIYDRDTEYGMVYGGLCTVGFAGWLHKRALADRIDEILFLAEENGIFSSAFEGLYDDIPTGTVSVNVPAAPMLDGRKRIAVAWSGQGGRDITGLARILKRAGISKKDLYVYLLADMGTADWEMMKHIGDMAVYLYSDAESSPLIDNISRNIKPLRRILAAMFAPDAVLEREAYFITHMNAEAAHDEDKQDNGMAGAKERSVCVQNGIRMFVQKYVDYFGKYPRLIDISARDAFSPINMLIDKHEYIDRFMESRDEVF